MAPLVWVLAGMTPLAPVVPVYVAMVMPLALVV